MYCSSLTSLTIPSSVTEIGPNAFNGCKGLKTITIGEGVTQIGKYAFSRCYPTEIKSYIVEPFATDNCFDNTIFSECTLRVPPGSLNKYKAVGEWNQFANIVEDETLGIDDVATDGFDDDAAFSIYNLNGNLLRHNCTQEVLGTLPHGIYIKVSPKGRKKIILRHQNHHTLTSESSYDFSLTIQDGLCLNIRL